jgi:hypothetical protein
MRLIISNNIAFTAEELSELSKTLPLTIQELSKFIENKTSQQYVIVQKDFVKAISKQLFNNTLHIFEVNNFINDNWIKIVNTNRSTTDKWKSELEQFEEVQ